MRNAGEPASATDISATSTGDDISGATDRTYNGVLSVDPGEFSGGDTAPVGGTESAEPAGSEPGKRGRGRPKGSRNATSKIAGPVAINVSGVEKLLLGIHTTLSTSFRVPELELDKQEAAEIAKAYAEVSKYYPSLAIPDDVAAMANFCGVISTVYGSRIMAYRMRKSFEKKNNKPPPVDPSASLQAKPPTQNAPGVAPKDEPRKVPEEAFRGEIPGVGTVVFPADHPLMGGRKIH